MSLALAEPMLATPTSSPRLPPGCAAEPKWDGFRALLAREVGRPARLVSRRGNELTPAFPEIIEAAAELPESLGDVVFDGELVIWNSGRLDFQLLLHRLPGLAVHEGRMGVPDDDVVLRLVLDEGRALLPAEVLALPPAVGLGRLLPLAPAQSGNGRRGR